VPDKINTFFNQYNKEEKLKKLERFKLETDNIDKPKKQGFQSR
jgi:hypothetical protein